MSAAPDPTMGKWADVRFATIPYPDLVQLRADLQKAIREREVIGRKITHSRVRAAWNQVEGPVEYRQRVWLDAVEAELARRKAA